VVSITHQLIKMKNCNIKKTTFDVKNEKNGGKIKQDQYKLFLAMEPNLVCQDVSLE